MDFRLIGNTYSIMVGWVKSSGEKPQKPAVELYFIANTVFLVNLL